MALRTKVEMAQAAKIITKPMIPATRSFLASATFSSLPAAVIHLKPPIRIITTAIMPKKPRAKLIMRAITVLKSVPAQARNCSNRFGHC